MIRRGGRLSARGKRRGGRKKPDPEYLMKSICVFIALLSSVIGAAAGEYYIVQDATTRHCTIVGIPPTTTQFVVLEKGKVFFDIDEAKEVVGSLTSCSSKTVSALASLSRQRRTAVKSRTAANKAARMAHSQSARSRAAGAQSHSVRSRAAIAHAQSVGSAHPFSSFFSLSR
jgi:hypothetical protein